ncbi:MAG: septum formation initiator family protein [Pseudomonadota bacterium]
MKRIIERFTVVALILWITVEVQGALWGASSYNTLKTRTAEYLELRDEVDALKKKTADLSRRADNLNRRSLDLEYLKERVRIVLGFVHQDEIVIPRDQFDAALKKGERGQR